MNTSNVSVFGSLCKHFLLPPFPFASFKLLDQSLPITKNTQIKRNIFKERYFNFFHRKCSIIRHQNYIFRKSNLINIFQMFPFPWFVYFLIPTFWLYLSYYWIKVYLQQKTHKLEIIFLKNDLLIFVILRIRHRNYIFQKSNLNTSNVSVFGNLCTNFLLRTFPFAFFKLFGKSLSRTKTPTHKKKKKDYDTDM